MRSLAVFVSWVALLSLTAAQETPKPGITWAKDWNAALEEAKIRNAPIHVAVHKDG